MDVPMMECLRTPGSFEQGALGSLFPPLDGDPTLSRIGIQLHELIKPHRVIDLKATTKKEALQELAALLEDDPNITNHNAFLEAIYKREELVSTGVGLGVAIPHVKIPEVKDYVVCVGRKVEGLEFDSLDSQPVRLVFMIGASERQTRDFVKMLARVMHLLKNGSNRVALLEANIPDQFLEIIRKDDLNGS